jgi:hypothetical protein
MKSRKSKGSLRDKSSAAYLEAFQADFEAHGVAAIEALRQKSPEKYAEIGSRLIAATEPASVTDFSVCNSMQDIGRKLLQSVGVNEPTDEMVEQAIAANDAFIARLEEIGGLNSNGHANSILLRPTIARSAPSAASASAAANPMPLVAPVIRICLSFTTQPSKALATRG